MEAQLTVAVDPIASKERGPKEGVNEQAADVDQEDVERKVLAQLVKKGFKEEDAKTAFSSTLAQAQAAGDLAQGFNEQRRRRLQRALDHLILYTPETDLPTEYNEAAATAKKRSKQAQSA
eukprot:gene3055-3881_t